MSSAAQVAVTCVVSSSYGGVGKATDMDAKSFEEKMNLALSQLVKKLLADLELLAALQ